MPGARLPRLATVALAAVTVALTSASCDTQQDPGPGAGDALPVVESSPDQPPSREAYAELATFVIPGRVVFFRPGSSADDPPELVRTITFPDVLVWDAQVDRDGYVWVATPDASRGVGGGALRTMLVVDPHLAEVHRVVDLPDELRAAAGVIVGPDGVYVSSWRDGFSGAVGVVPRSCTTEAGDCVGRVLADLGNVGVTSERPFLLQGDDLYAFRGQSSRQEAGGVLRIALPSGEVLDRYDYRGGSFAATDEAIYTLGFFEPNVNSLVRVDLRTLEETERASLDSSFDRAQAVIAEYDGRLYLAGYQTPSVEVRSAVTLEVLDRINLPAPSENPANNFGFVAPGLLLLNERDFVDVRTGEVLAGVLPIEPQPGAQALRLPEGHPLADGGSF